MRQSSVGEGACIEPKMCPPTWSESRTSTTATGESFRGVSGFARTRPARFSRVSRGNVATVMEDMVAGRLDVAVSCSSLWGYEAVDRCSGIVPDQFTVFNSKTCAL